MSESSRSFIDFISRSVEVLESPPPIITDDRYMFRVGDRWVELVYRAKDDCVTLAAIAYMRRIEETLRADLIAAFNAYYLFKGGFALVMSQDALVYLCQAHRLSRLDPTQIRSTLESFASEAARAGTWYMVECDQSEQPPPAPRSSTTNEPLLRV